jgi:hypothetical protein
MSADYRNPKWRTVDRNLTFLCYGMRYRRNSNGYSTFSVMPYSPVTLPTLPDVGRLPKFKMADCRPELPVSLLWNEISTKLQRLAHTLAHGQLTGDTADIVRYQRTSEIQKWWHANRRYPYLWYGKRCQRNSNGHPTYAAMPYPPVTLPTLPDVGRLPKFKMADCRPELNVFVLWNKILTKFQRLAHILAHGQLTGDTADIVRYQRTTEIQK